MKKEMEELGNIYESFSKKDNTLSSLVQDTLDWLLQIEDFDEAEDSCNMELDYVGGGRESVVYRENGVMIKLNTRPREEWEQFIGLLCFAKTELIDAEFGLVILQEELTLDGTEFCENDIESEIEACLKASNVSYDRREITDENAGLNDLGEWKLFDIPIN